MCPARFNLIVCQLPCSKFGNPFLIHACSNQKGGCVKTCNFQRKRKLFFEKEKRKPICSPTENDGSKLKIRHNKE
jgi:hypothetical protein